MSVIETFYNTTMTVKDKATLTGSKTTGYTTLGSGIRCVVMPVVELDQLYNQSNIGKEFDIYSDTTVAIRNGYIINIGSDEYGVAGVSLYEDGFEGKDAHYKVRAVKK